MPPTRLPSSMVIARRRVDQRGGDGCQPAGVDNRALLGLLTRGGQDAVAETPLPSPPGRQQKSAGRFAVAHHIGSTVGS
jgi:hypothetical protein